LIVVDSGVKINGQYYPDTLLSQKMLLVINNVAGDMVIFQQDSTPAHSTRETIQLLQCKTPPTFIGPELWLPNSPDLNPVDYKIWGLFSEMKSRSPTVLVAGIRKH